MHCYVTVTGKENLMFVFDKIRRIRWNLRFARLLLRSEARRVWGATRMRFERRLQKRLAA